MRWGLWMAPVINSFLRQSPDPTWYNQDGAVRTSGGDRRRHRPAQCRFPRLQPRHLPRPARLRLAARADLVRSYGPARGDAWSISRFVGGDRADEAAGRFLGHGQRTRVIPDGIRRFATWAPLLIPFYIPRGAEWDKAWTGAETLRNAGGPMPGPVRTLAIAYGVAGDRRGARRRSSSPAARARSRRRRAGARGRAARRSANCRASFAFNNGAVGVEIQRDGRGAAFVMGARARQFPDRSHPPPARSAAVARPVLLCRRGGRGALVDRLTSRRAAPATMRSSETGRNRPRDRQRDRRRRGARWRSRPDARGRDADPGASRSPTNRAGRAACG